MTARTADSAAHDSAAGPFCPRCGRPERETEHSACATALTLEPPRFCRECRRRMVVQVTPAGWTAACTRHGAP